jgi:hypothetical protein
MKININKSLKIWIQLEFWFCGSHYTGLAGLIRHLCHLEPY